MYKILMVEDDLLIAEKSCQFLNSWGYQGFYVKDFEHVMEVFAQVDPDLVIMDALLPKTNGFEWTRRIRKVSKVPILFLSSASEDINIITGIMQGADDYMTKPFELQVLAAKIQALLRRSYDFAGKTRFLELGELRLFTDDGKITYLEKSAELTRNESRILKMLMERKNTIVSREDLMQGLWNTDCYIDENTLSVNVNRLRRKLESVGASDMIATHKGIGYRIGKKPDEVD